MDRLKKNCAGVWFVMTSEAMPRQEKHLWFPGCMRPKQGFVQKRFLLLNTPRLAGTLPGTKEANRRYFVTFMIYLRL